MEESTDDEAARPPSPSHSQLPMTPVPLALQIVLTETARSIYHQKASSHESVLSHELLLGRASAQDLRAPEPGYPDYNASIMDGYAIRTRDLDDVRTQYGSLSRDEKKSFVLGFDLVGKVYAGDDRAGEIASSQGGSQYSVRSVGSAHQHRNVCCRDCWKEWIKYSWHAARANCERPRAKSSEWRWKVNVPCPPARRPGRAVCTSSVCRWLAPPR